LKDRIRNEETRGNKDCGIQNAVRWIKAGRRCWRDYVERLAKTHRNRNHTILAHRKDRRKDGMSIGHWNHKKVEEMQM
jgi:hypothetical protein